MANAHNHEEWQQRRELARSEGERIADRRLALFVSKFIAPLLTVIVIGLFTWVWTTTTDVALLRRELERVRDTTLPHMQTHIDELRNGTTDRFTRTQADLAHEKLRDWVRDHHNHDEFRSGIHDLAYDSEEFDKRLRAIEQAHAGLASHVDGWRHPPTSDTKKKHGKNEP